MAWFFTKFLLLTMTLVSYQLSTDVTEFLVAYAQSTNNNVNWPVVGMVISADVMSQHLRRALRRKRIRQLLKDRCKLGEYFTLVRDMRRGDGTDFFQYFRMSVERFDALLAMVGPLIRPKKVTRRSVSAGEKLAFTLRYLAHGSSMRILAKSYRICDATASRIVRTTCIALRLVLEPHYMPPPTAKRWKEIARDFENMWNFPNCIGAIDGKHVRIEAPPDSGSLFYNYKGFFSIILLAVCDAKYRFTKVDIGECGSAGDAGLFNNCKLGKDMKLGHLSIPEPRQIPGATMMMPYVMVGDEAFPLSENLMRPYPRVNLNAETRIFNYRLSRARRVIENAFGILVSRWRILHQEIKASVETIDAMVWALVLLHNYLRTCDEEQGTTFSYCAPGDVDGVDVNGQIVPGRWRSEGCAGVAHLKQCGINYTRYTKRIRDMFKSYFNSAHGRVPWQDDMVHRSS